MGLAHRGKKEGEGKRRGGLLMCLLGREGERRRAKVASWDEPSGKEGVHRIGVLLYFLF